MKHDAPAPLSRPPLHDEALPVFFVPHSRKQKGGLHITTRLFPAALRIEKPVANPLACEAVFLCGLTLFWWSGGRLDDYILLTNE